MKPNPKRIASDMRGGRYRVISLILAVLMILSTLTSCNRRYDEAEVTEAAKKLLKTAEMLSAGGNSVMVMGEIPENIRYRQLIKLTEKGLETVNGND